MGSTKRSKLPADENQTLQEGMAPQQAALERDAGVEAEEAPKKKAPYTRHLSLGGLYEATGVEANTFASTENGTFEGRIYFRDGDPGPEVRAYLKNNNFDFDRHGEREPSKHFGVKKPWFIPIPYEGGDARDTLVRVAAGANQMIRRAKGLDQAQGQSRGF